MADVYDLARFAFASSFTRGTGKNEQFTSAIFFFFIIDRIYRIFFIKEKKEARSAKTSLLDQSQHEIRGTNQANEAY